MRFYALLSLLAGASIVSGAVVSSNGAAAASTPSLVRRGDSKPDILVVPPNRELQVRVPVDDKHFRTETIKGVTNVFQKDVDGVKIVAISNSTDLEVNSKLSEWMTKHTDTTALKKYLASHPHERDLLLAGTIASIWLIRMKAFAMLFGFPLAASSMATIGVAIGGTVFALKSLITPPESHIRVGRPTASSSIARHAYSDDANKAHSNDKLIL
ncbi:hypothetical protein SYNPS1DRAFT_31479 [Syncephalis pseudoplumigaleata]|uniref:RxLR effector protein n=1 Tax=Syncephalis pseudoplumigaleata TaxID=1712513 RepID=A0A4P9YVA7_9FUNG|nr:hypothetical protein SYNPS1DRAFT_31479 [Syncephalis pseudoplumigaleata]|eukprot:RKP22850.1 hypothetical protein SYNPS1DRAFT_31479 [Syncephalis pseudoplumigaleata]